MDVDIPLPVLASEVADHFAHTTSDARLLCLPCEAPLGNDEDTIFSRWANGLSAEEVMADDLRKSFERLFLSARA